MMRFWLKRGRLLRLWIPSGSVLALGGCSWLSDQQLTGILTSVITTGLTTLVNSVLLGLAQTATG